MNENITAYSIYSQKAKKQTKPYQQSILEDDDIPF